MKKERRYAVNNWLDTYESLTDEKYKELLEGSSLIEYNSDKVKNLKYFNSNTYIV